MRGLCIAAFVCFGCGESEPMSPHEEYVALEAHVDIDCGTYERNYTPSHALVPEHLCGPRPEVACINEAIAGDKIAKLKYSYLDPASAYLREQNYYAGNDQLTWIGYFERDAASTSWWYWGDCTAVDAEEYEYDGMSCWKITGVDCAIH